jgi:transcriptional regulator with XRE-family HTH domain
MTLLRVTLYSLHDQTVHVHGFTEKRQLEAAVKILLANSERKFAIDVAFAELAHLEMCRLLGSSEDRVLISDRALCVLRSNVTADASTVARLDEVWFHVATSAWGEICGISRISSAPDLPEPVSWVATLKAQDRSLAAFATKFNIWNDTSYIANESKLSDAIRISLARARFTLLSGSPPTPISILDNIERCPPWVINRPFQDLAVNVRQANALRAYHLNRVGDLARLGTNGLLKMPNLGLKSVRDLGETIYTLLVSAPVEQHHQRLAEEVKQQKYPEEPEEFASALRRWAEDQGTAAAKVISGRLGLHSERLTLQQIADELGVTRERVRQIETKAISKLHGNPLLESVALRIEALLKDRVTPLRLDSIQKENTWFGDEGSGQYHLRFVITNFLAGRLHVLDLDGVPTISAISDASLNQAIIDARIILGASAQLDLDAPTERLTAVILANEGAELRGYLSALLGSRQSRVNQTLSLPRPKFMQNEDDLISLKLQKEILRRDLSSIG